MRGRRSFLRAMGPIPFRSCARQFDGQFTAVNGSLAVDGFLSDVAELSKGVRSPLSGLRVRAVHGDSRVDDVDLAVSRETRNSKSPRKGQFSSTTSVIPSNCSTVCSVTPSLRHSDSRQLAGSIPQSEEVVTDRTLDHVRENPAGLTSCVRIDGHDDPVVRRGDAVVP